MTRVVQLSDDAYDRLKSLKLPGESFSQTVLRLVGRGDLGKLKGLRSASELRKAEETLREVDALDR